MRKILPIVFIIVLFTGFAIFDTTRKSTVKVLKVINASEIIVDLNQNNTADTDENICVDIKTLSANPYKNQSELAKKLKLSDIDALKFGYLSDLYADNELTDKYVKLKYLNKKDYRCKYADIIINGTSYRDKLSASGFGFDNNPSENFYKQLEKAKNLNLVILNHKSNKYHKLDCPYGISAGDSIIIKQKQVPQNAKPCQFCHVQKTNNPKIFQSAYPNIISAGNVKLYLTDLTTKLKPDKNCNTLACREILSQINNAKSSIDIALYGFDYIPDIYNALKNAKSRNVKINMVYDNSKTSYYPETQKYLNLADKNSGDGKDTLMHNKFIIFDDNTVATGSMNFSSTGFSGYNSNSLVIINSKEISDIYKTEFTQMLNGNFSKNKSKISAKKINVNNINITPLFSPSNKIITNEIIPLINSAKSYIYLPAFVITHDALSKSLINAKQRGVKVKIIVDATGLYSTSSKIKTLRDKGIQVKVENYAGKMHSKSIIIDDRYIITGSMNFTYSGENKNDENMLIIENERLASYYKKFFEYLWEKIPEKYLYQNIRAESKESIGSCYDGIDNDFDGKIDKDDEGCY